MTSLKALNLCITFVFPLFLHCQDSEKAPKSQGMEIGGDFTMGGTNRGNHFGGGIKLGFNVKEYLVAGPIVRYNRINSLEKSFFGGKSQFDSYGGGGFMELRFVEVLFVGLEVTALNSPFKLNEFSYSIDLDKEKWIICAFISAGFSVNIKDKIRLNGCVSYDVINRGNSPFFLSYPIFENGGKKSAIPIMYRLGMSIPIVRK